MLYRNRAFKREAPTRDAKKIFIFCEGVKREYQYFKFFEELDSRINICIYELKPTENNSPSGLLSIARSCLLNDDYEKDPYFELRQEDEVWIIFDLDPDSRNSRLPQALETMKKCKTEKGWFTALSNPCFEVWLYYHFFSDDLVKDHIEKCTTWKTTLNTLISGGFDSRKHPILIEAAYQNASDKFTDDNGLPAVGSTEVYNLAASMLPLIKKKLDRALGLLT